MFLHCHDSLNWQNAGLVTVAAALYYCNKMGWGKWYEVNGELIEQVEEGIPIL